MYRQNPKLVGSNVIDCTPQSGPCPVGCNQCYYNRDDTLWKPNVPKKAEAANYIVRMNTLHDSNIERNKVLRAAKQYKHVFFNTSIAQFDKLPGPIVYTANNDEEQPVDMTFLRLPDVCKLMFIRLRVSATNLVHVAIAVRAITSHCGIPIVLTFMAYYDADIQTMHSFDDGMSNMLCYRWGIRHVNSYWCPTRAFKKYALERMRDIPENDRYEPRQITLCGSLDNNFCKDCRNCEAYYWITYKRLQETEDDKND